MDHAHRAGVYSDPLFGFLDVTVREDAAKEFGAHAQRLREYAAGSTSYAYLFESLAALCDILEIKYDLGKRTRDAYSSGDRDALAALLPEYAKCATRVEKFHRAFSKQWHKENKPHGFEIQDARLGGLMMRLKSAMERIEAYLAGRVATLEELDEELLPYSLRRDGAHIIDGTPGTKGIPNLDRRAYAVSVNGGV